MLCWKPFDYKTYDEFAYDIEREGINLPLSRDTNVLGESMPLFGKTLKNRLAIHPMTSFDCTLEGTPTELTFRRYRRFSAGGSGLIWLESCAVSEDSKSNLHDFMLNDKNCEVCKKLVKEIKENAADGEEPLTVLQLTHCGRNSGLGAISVPPYVTYESPWLKREKAVYLTDEKLKSIQDDYVHSAKLAKEAGFDAIDMRACHGFLISELLSAFTRKDSIYGGERFENRTRFLIELVERVNDEVGINQAIRLNVCDLIPFPYGWGMKDDGSMTPDLEEPFALIKMLKERGIKLFSIAAGRNHIPHIQMPYNRASHHPRESQLKGMEEYHGFAAAVKRVFPELIVMTGALSWASIYSPYVAAGGIEQHKFDIAGFGRMAYANPDFAAQILKDGEIDREKACICCERCGDIRAYSRKTGGCPAGCVIRDSKIYMPYFKKYVPDGKPTPIGKDTIELFDLVE